MSCCILIVKLSLFAQLFLMYFVRQKNRDSNEKVKEDLAKTDAKKLFEVCFCFDLFFSYFVSLTFLCIDSYIYFIISPFSSVLLH